MALREGIGRSDGSRLDHLHWYDIREIRRRLTDYILRDIEGRGYFAKAPLANVDQVRQAVDDVMAAVDRLDEVVYGTEAEQQARAAKLPPMFDLKTAAGAAGEGGRIRAHRQQPATDHAQFWSDNDVVRINAHSVRLRSSDGKEYTQRYDTKAEKERPKHWSVCPSEEE